MVESKIQRMVFQFPFMSSWNDAKHFAITFISVKSSSLFMSLCVRVYVSGLPFIHIYVNEIDNIFKQKTPAFHSHVKKLWTK